jgi:hypothetical protein
MLGCLICALEDWRPRGFVIAASNFALGMPVFLAYLLWRARRAKTVGALFLTPTDAL